LVKIGIYAKYKFTVIYQWNFSEIEVYFLPPLPLRRRGIIPLLRRGKGWSFGGNN
jgi:hypothetical protein